jgi:hypothetical protein
MRREATPPLALPWDLQHVATAGPLGGRTVVRSRRELHLTFPIAAFPSRFYFAFPRSSLPLCTNQTLPTIWQGPREYRELGRRQTCLALPSNRSRSSGCVARASFASGDSWQSILPGVVGQQEALVTCGPRQRLRGVRRRGRLLHEGEIFSLTTTTTTLPSSSRAHMARSRSIELTGMLVDP